MFLSPGAWQRLLILNRPTRETELYEKVSAYLQRPDSIAFGLRPNQLVIIQARKILGSSVAAIVGLSANRPRPFAAAKRLPTFLR